MLRACLHICGLRLTLFLSRLRGMELVFQYGSNCSVERLNGRDRLNGAARPAGIAETVDDYSLAFDVWSDSNNCAASDIVRVTGCKVWGVLYEIPANLIFGKRADKRKTLEQIEGRRYRPIRIRVRLQNGLELAALTFVARDDDRQERLRTSAEYLGHIIRGLREQGVSEEYIGTVKQIAAENNPAMRDSVEQL